RCQVSALHYLSMFAHSARRCHRLLWARCFGLLHYFVQDRHSRVPYRVSHCQTPGSGRAAPGFVLACQPGRYVIWPAVPPGPVGAMRVHCLIVLPVPPDLPVGPDWRIAVPVVA
ncbi:MAG TPA: hypothetical protein DCY62_00750, partial [Thalassospira sp.]|nr:hypothetical protein [Thalassospira sp.]